MGKTGEIPPAQGLHCLTDAQVKKIDRLCAEVIAVGHGVIKITIEGGLPRFVSKSQSEELRPG